MSRNRSLLVGERVRIYLRGSVWWANVQTGRGQQIRRSLHTTNQQEARRRALALEREKLENANVAVRTSPVTVREAAEALMRNARVEGLADRTLAKYQTVLNRIGETAEAGGRHNLVDLDAAFVDEYRELRLEQNAASKTIYNEVVLIRQLVNFAVRRRLVQFDPLAGLRIREPRPNPQPCWTREQVEQIIAAADEPQKSIYTVLADTGARIGEVKWLTWDDVDFEANVLHIRPKPGWSSKTGNIRAIPMLDRVHSVISRLPRRAEWVFTAPPSTRYPLGDHQVSERRLLTSLKRLLKKLSLSGHLHTFRHTFVSLAVTGGVAEAVIRGWVGHVDSDTLRLYTHIADGHSQAAMRRLSHSNEGDPK